MKYIPLSSLQNSYSSILKYRKEQNSVSIDGFYPENSLNIPVQNTDLVGIISGTTFRFIVNLDEGGLYTSDSFYNDLVRANQSKNPYFINAALNPKSIINISISQLRTTFNRRTEKEIPEGVTCIFNNLFDGGGGLNIQRFGEYIDWVVSKPNLNETIDGGVLQSSRISRFEINPPLVSIEIDDDSSEESSSTEGGGSTTGGGSTGGGPVGGEGEQGNPIPGGGGEPSFPQPGGGGVPGEGNPRNPDRER